MKRELVLSKIQIKRICKRIANDLNDLFEKEHIITPVFIGVLKGSAPFMMDLIKNIKADIELDFIQVSSYVGESSSGNIVLKKDISADIKNRTIILVEDVVDTGLTMDWLKKHFNEKYHPKNIYVVSLFDKTFMRKVDIDIDFVGKQLNENKFLMGYGLDYNELCRNTPYVYVATKEDIERIDKISKRV